MEVVNKTKSICVYDIMLDQPVFTVALSIGSYCKADSGHDVQKITHP